MRRHRTTELFYAVAAVAVALAVSGCAGVDRFAAFPTSAPSGGYPALVPIDDLLAQADSFPAGPPP